jgi:hypothetical protein
MRDRKELRDQELRRAQVERIDILTDGTSCNLSFSFSNGESGDEPAAKAAQAAPLALGGKLTPP